MDHVGNALLFVPNQMGMDTTNPAQAAVVGGAEVYGLAYLTDVFCAIPTMLMMEPQNAHESLATFACYDLTWPCRLVGLMTPLYDNNRAYDPLENKIYKQIVDDGITNNYINIGGLSKYIKIPYPWTINSDIGARTV
jgi:hypothetical protein